MSENIGKDFTTGSIPRHLLKFSIPMLIGNLLQTSYNVVNTIWIGNIVGENGVGATAVSMPIIFICIALAIGSTMATTILVSNYYGAKNNSMVKKVVNNSFVFTFILGGFITAFGFLSTDFILKVIRTPVEIMPLASVYLKISFAGFLLIQFSILISSILRGIGDSLTPLIFTAAGVILNAILDPLLIIGVGFFPKLGLSGAAYASLISQGAALIIALYYLRHKDNFIRVDLRNFKLDKDLTLSLCKLGLPIAIQQALTSIGALLITSFVNSFGAEAINAFGAGGRIDSVAFMPAQSLGSAASTLTGQNIGANKPERIKEVFRSGIILSSIITIAISFLTLVMPGIILSMFGFSRSTNGFTIGVQYLRINGAAYILYSIMFIVNGVINGTGNTMTTMVISLLSLWIIRIPLSAFMSGKSLGVTGIWIAIVVSNGAAMLASIIYYYTGRWRSNTILNTPNSTIDKFLDVSEH